MTITVPSDDVICTTNSLYCKTPAALQIALDALRSIGYTIEDLRDPNNGYSSHTDRGIITEQMEQNGCPLWHAHFEDIRYGKCGSCNAYISTHGISMHGHTCEVCKAVTYLELTEGSIIEFTFRGTDEGPFSPRLKMTVKRWDAQDGWLYLKREPAFVNATDPEEAEAYLTQHADQWEALEEDGQPLIKLRYHLHRTMEPINPKTVISVKDTWGPYRNYKIVNLWKGMEYDELGCSGKKLTIPESINIYETWRWTTQDFTKEVPRQPHQ